eukprot:Gb_06796 [translate_table: standard]
MATKTSSRPVLQPRVVQHKQEAFWFYRVLSIIYDPISTFFCTQKMRTDSMEQFDLNSRDLVVVDVGGGTGLSTLGIVQHVDAKNVSILDQSPHQLAKAKQKEALKECTFLQGDAEDLPFPTDYAHRYYSLGSIEYWPEPQRAINEAYRVLKKGGKACIVGPVYPTNWLARLVADIWMLFPKEEDYFMWFRKAGFTDIELKKIGPEWFRSERKYGLIIGCSVVGIKPESGDSPLKLGAKVEVIRSHVNPLEVLFKFSRGIIVGNVATLYFFLVSGYMLIKDKVL